MRPDKQGTYRYASAISIDHPNAIKTHENYVNESVNIQDVIEKGLVKEYNQ
jgi:hypothetical protein